MTKAERPAFGNLAAASPLTFCAIVKSLLNGRMGVDFVDDPFEAMILRGFANLEHATPCICPPHRYAKLGKRLEVAN